MIRQRILLIWEQELVSLEVYCSLAYISLRIPWDVRRQEPRGEKNATAL